MKLLVLDGNSIVNRAFYGIKLLTTKDGRFTNAIVGFMNILLKLEAEEKPDEVAVAFDLKAPTFRHKMYSGYKAQRKGMPEELAAQLPVLKELLADLGYKMVTCEGYEADDILGTLAAANEAAGGTTLLATGDRDSLQLAGVPRIEIERDATKVRIHIHCAKPGMVIGKGGAEIEKLRAQCEKIINKNREVPAKVFINIVEVKQPDKDAQLVAENVASQLERRISFRRAMKQCIGRTMKLGAQGIKIQVSGRLGGAEIARSEHYHEGTIPLQTLRADIDYGFAEANTTYGKIGVKVWIYAGEVLQAVKRQPRKEGGKN